MAANLTRLRKARGLSLRQLSAALDASQPIGPDGLNRAEKGTRQVTTDELVALAVALNVNPSALLLPPHDANDLLTEVTGYGTVDLMTAWDWMDGKEPLSVPEDDTDGVTRAEFQNQGRPPIRRAFDTLTRTGRNFKGAQLEGVDGVKITRDSNGDVIDIEWGQPGARKSWRPAREEGSPDGG